MTNDDQLQAVADTARRARDWTRLALCQRALNVLSLEPPAAPAAYRVAVSLARTRSVADARAECLRGLTREP